MEATFDVTADPVSGMLRITMGGFFAPGDIARFTAAIGDGLARLKTAPNQHRTLVDIRHMDIQAGEAVAEFQRILANPRTASPCIAFVVAKSLAAMQVRRAASSRAACYFDTVEAAETWLLAIDLGTTPRRSAG
ncbi:hypothetical protein [Sphingomonas sp. Leaf10]|jgi:hypothetical protein|uniref:hypothetical protein n=1 Tax=Sphingomonas sp. Leaf10 TaxID=1735676 RepID=UPI0006F99B9F|nr:hypothetical protein [Sphingomonas sp. Leaf10]KQM31329.1 hypothetical protein ASE59_06880 [Sphingomonas sp. Leaf10]